MRHQHTEGKWERAGVWACVLEENKELVSHSGTRQKHCALDKVRRAGVIKVFLISLFVEEGFNCNFLKYADGNAVMSWKAAEDFVYC